MYGIDLKTMKGDEACPSEMDRDRAYQIGKAVGVLRARLRARIRARLRAVELCRDRPKVFMRLKNFLGKDRELINTILINQSNLID